MKVNEDITHVISRLAKLEQHIINLIVPIQQVAHILESPKDIRTLINLLSQPLKINETSLLEFFSKLNVSLEKFKIEINRYKNQCEKLDMSQSFNEIKYIGKRLNEIEGTLKEMKNEGIKKKIHLDLTMDGYEMIKKSRSFEVEENINRNVKNIDGEEHNLNLLLKSISIREAKVVIHRIGLLGEKAKTYAEIGRLFQISGERVSQIFRKTLRKFGHPSRIEMVRKTNHKKLIALVGLES